MGEVQRDVQAALAAIESTNLTPTEHTLLEQFINGAVDSAYAARFVLRWINDNDHGSVQSALQNLKQSLRELSTILTRVVRVSPNAHDLAHSRDGPSCCMREDSNPSMVERAEPAYIIRPSIFDDREMEPKGKLYSVLEAFFTPQKLAKLRNILQDNTDQGLLKNH
ncbi:hypothetical protein EMCG_01568 [[Emmonsia] crescens]|uniref:Uncharacterized protein n=1 Tax=[Emmonsia] crescens TaxID=73230 RepID=A0A0G2I0F5_9EURO|nr:hypothetical protein EMCG_01568 [Emmonsia crescens UAMH 3008]